MSRTNHHFRRTDPMAWEVAHHRRAVEWNHRPVEPRHKAIADNLASLRDDGNDGDPVFRHPAWDEPMSDDYHLHLAYMEWANSEDEALADWEKELLGLDGATDTETSRLTHTTASRPVGVTTYQEDIDEWTPPIIERFEDEDDDVETAIFADTNVTGARAARFRFCRSASSAATSISPLPVGSPSTATPPRSGSRLRGGQESRCGC